MAQDVGTLTEQLGSCGSDASDEKLRLINVARAAARFRAFPDDIGIALEGNQLFACIRPILKLLDGHVIAGLAAGAPREKGARDIDHMRRALAFIEQRRTAPGTEASGRPRPRILEGSDVSLAL